MGRKKGTDYACVTKRKRKQNIGLTCARQVLQERKSNALATVSFPEHEIDDNENSATTVDTNNVDNMCQLDCMNRDDNHLNRNNIPQYSVQVEEVLSDMNKENLQENQTQPMDLESDDDFVIESNKESSSSISIEGRRIVDFQYLFDQLVTISDHNDRFGCKLSNLLIKKEKVQSFASKIYLSCSMCGSRFEVNTCESKKKELDVNHSAVSGIISIGCGRANLNELAASINLPLISKSTYQKCHDNLYDWWKTTAESCMIAAGKEEASMAMEKGSVSPSGVPSISVTADAAWGKRSYKTNFSSATGVGAIIGVNTGKILHVGIKNKYCIICSRAANKCVTPPEHLCNANHSGSSTSMEKAVIVEGFRNSVEKHNLVYAKLIADGDSSTYKNILESRPYPNVIVEKIECTNHLMRNYNGKILSLIKDTSIPLNQRKLLNTDRVRRLRVAAKAAVRFRMAQNLSTAEKIKFLQKDIINSPKHIFGDHSECEDYYCGDDKKSEVNLGPGVKTLMQKLNAIASSLAFNARSLLHNLNNNRAEQFNSIVAKYVGGKRINYSLKKSYALRCYAAVVAFNTGKPISQFYKTIFNSSPSRATKKFEALKCQTNRNINKYKPKRKLVFHNNNLDYGDSCQRPDMSEEQYSEAKLLFIQNLKSQLEQRHDIERDTILQAESALWLELRRSLLTASNFSKVCKRRNSISSAGLVKNLLYKYSLDHVAAIRHGKANEKNALGQLERQENIVLEKCGLFIDDEHFFLGATPDALFEEGIVELKCPISAFGMNPDDAIKEKKIKFWKIQNNEITININHDWWYQVQGQLHITKKDLCLFAVWTGPEQPLKIEKIYRDDAFWKNKMEKRLVDFYNTCLLPEIIDPRKTRSMPLRDTTF